MNTKLVLFATLLMLFSTLHSAKAQSVRTRQILDYYALKGLLLKHKATVESMLSMKRFKLASTKERPESTIYGYKKESDSTQILVRVRKTDGLVNEIAWDEGRLTLGNLKHDAVYDGFVPVTGNNQYYNRFQKIALLVNYELAHQDSVVPCILRTTE